MLSRRAQKVGGVKLWLTVARCSVKSQCHDFEGDKLKGPQKEWDFRQDTYTVNSLSGTPGVVVQV